MVLCLMRWFFGFACNFELTFPTALPQALIVPQ